jgi:hypothetical protein
MVYQSKAAKSTRSWVCETFVEFSSALLLCGFVKDNRCWSTPRLVVTHERNAGYEETPLSCFVEEGPAVERKFQFLFSRFAGWVLSVVR